MFHVKHPEYDASEIAGLIEKMGASVTEEDAQALLDHLLWVIDTNRTHNLTAITDLGEAVRLHLLDSITPIPEIEGAPEGDLLDIGSGGGFPGLPLAIVTGRRTVLLDSVGKKVRLVGEFAHTAGLQVGIAPVRAEEHALEAPGHYAVVVARAVSQLPSIVELAAPLLMNAGRFVALKGPLSDDELERGDEAAAKCGMRRVSVRRLELPHGPEERTIVAYERVADPSVKLPRRVGMAQKRPFA